jgi:hypothetical protein
MNDFMIWGESGSELSVVCAKVTNCNLEDCYFFLCTFAAIPQGGTQAGDWMAWRDVTAFCELSRQL